MGLYSIMCLETVVQQMSEDIGQLVCATIVSGWT